MTQTSTIKKKQGNCHKKWETTVLDHLDGVLQNISLTYTQSAATRKQAPLSESGETSSEILSRTSKASVTHPEWAKPRLHTRSEASAQEAPSLQPTKLLSAWRDAEVSPPLMCFSGSSNRAETSNLWKDKGVLISADLSWTNNTNNSTTVTKEDPAVTPLPEGPQEEPPGQNTAANLQYIYYNCCCYCLD